MMKVAPEMAHQAKSFLFFGVDIIAPPLTSVQLA
jgi:hypothetical protein